MRTFDLAHTPSEGFHLLHKDLSQVRRIAQDQRLYLRPFDPPTLLFRRIAESRIPLISNDIKVIMQRFYAAFCNFITEQSQNNEWNPAYFFAKPIMTPQFKQVF
jgi:hypothetical protein